MVTEKQKIKAVSRAGGYVKKWGIQEPSCQICGTAKAHKHHTDYSKPLEVAFLCCKCHFAVHRKGVECPPAVDLRDLKKTGLYTPSSVITPLTNELKKKFFDKCERECRTPSKMIRIWIEKFVAKEDEDDDS